VAGAVELVHRIEIPPSFLGLFLDLEVRVQVPVGPLGGGDDIDEVIAILLELGVLAVLQDVGGAFNDLVDVRIVEEVALVLAFLLTGRNLEIADAPRLVTLIEDVGQCGLRVGFDLLVPDTAGDANLLERCGLDRSGSNRRRTTR